MGEKIGYVKKMLREFLKDVNNLIEENEELQKKYPDHKRGLKIALVTLKKLKEDIEEALTN